MKYHPAFIAAIDAHERAVEQYGRNHPEAMLAMEKVAAMAPKEIQDHIIKRGTEMGLIPPAGGYLEDGTPVYRLEDVAEKMGLPMEEAQAFITRFDDERAAAGLSHGLVNPNQVFTKQ